MKREDNNEIVLIESRYLYIYIKAKWRESLPSYFAPHSLTNNHNILIYSLDLVVSYWWILFKLLNPTLS